MSALVSVEVHLVDLSKVACDVESPVLFFLATCPSDGPCPPARGPSVALAAPVRGARRRARKQARNEPLLYLHLSLLYSLEHAHPRVRVAHKKMTVLRNPLRPASCQRV